jgi:hypothetical protein
MRQAIYILTFLFLLTACNQNGSTINEVESDSLKNKITTGTTRTENISETERKSVIDSLIIPYDTLFSDMNLVLTEISKKQFQSYSDKYKISCEIDSGQFIKGSGIYVQHDCNEICETYLCEKATNRRMAVPTDYDAGILSMLFSPSCSQLLICSSYDGPDFENYYSHRAEIFVYTVSTGNGLHGIKPSLKFYAKDWSIDDIIWVNDKTIALKVYEERRQGDGSGNNYKYYKTDFDK